MKQVIDKILTLTNHELDAIDYSKYNLALSINDEYKNYFLERSGKEHYRLLSFISTLFNNLKILDIGTNRGYSAIALSYNKNNKVISYDIQRYNTIEFLESQEVLKNIRFEIGNCLDFEDLHEYPLILLDTAHDGVFEKLVIEKLENIKWSGILLMDDVIYFPALKAMWDSFNIDKYDITHLGHISGTGMLIFNGEEE